MVSGFHLSNCSTSQSRIRCMHYYFHSSDLKFCIQSSCFPFSRLHSYFLFSFQVLNDSYGNSCWKQSNAKQNTWFVPHYQQTHSMHYTPFRHNSFATDSFLLLSDKFYLVPLQKFQTSSLWIGLGLKRSSAPSMILYKIVCLIYLNYFFKWSLIK